MARALGPRGGAARVAAGGAGACCGLSSDRLLSHDDGVIISHEHRFIFIKTQKTAGTSIEVLLADLAGDDAVVTPVKPPVVGHRPRNFQRTGRPVVDVPHALRGGLRQLRHMATRTPGRPGVAFYNHISASRVVELVGRRTWDSYFTFTFERNPWDKVASAYFWQQDAGSSPEDFRSWVASRRPATEQIYTTAGSLPVDFPRYSLDGVQVGVDFVGRFEQLDGDLRRVLSEVGLVGAELPRSKSGTRPEVSLAELSDDESIERVASAFTAEQAAFGYCFPS